MARHRLRGLATGIASEQLTGGRRWRQRVDTRTGAHGENGGSPRALGGVLADVGYDVFAVNALLELDARPKFIGWVGGEETAANVTSSLTSMRGRRQSVSVSAASILGQYRARRSP